MYCCTRPVARAPSVYRAARNATSFFPAQVAARIVPQAQSDFAPFLRLLDDIATPFAPAYTQHARQVLSNFGGAFPAAPTSFTPEFDVKEVGSKYELSVNVPGYEGTDLDVEFSDAQTLVISGRMNKEVTSGEPQINAANAVAETSASESAAQDMTLDNDDNASNYSTGSYQRPTVEEADGESAQLSSEAEHSKTPEATVVAQQSTAISEAPVQTPGQYWVKERRTGSFKRVFKFENRVDQDGVQANLKNGVLNIVVPKAEAPVARKISVQ